MLDFGVLLLLWLHLQKHKENLITAPLSLWDTCLNSTGTVTFQQRCSWNLKLQTVEINSIQWYNKIVLLRTGTFILMFFLPSPVSLSLYLFSLVSMTQEGNPSGKNLSGMSFAPTWPTPAGVLSAWQIPVQTLTSPNCKKQFFKHSFSSTLF